MKRWTKLLNLVIKSLSVYLINIRSRVQIVVRKENTPTHCSNVVVNCKLNIMMMMMGRIRTAQQSAHLITLMTGSVLWWVISCGIPCGTMIPWSCPRKQSWFSTLQRERWKAELVVGVRAKWCIVALNVNSKEQKVTSNRTRLFLSDLSLTTSSYIFRLYIHTAS